jgi:hypothetical protein
MIDPSESVIQQVSVHHVGNAGLEEGVKLSDAPLDVTEEKVYSLLRSYFLSSFTIPEYYTLSYGEDDFTENPLYQFAEAIFNDPETLHETSAAISQYLYNSSQHPNIKSGELYVAYFSSLALNGQHTEAIGIFKSEVKESYLKLKAYANQFDLHADEGINIRKLDKGCLILNLEKESGFKVMMVDNSNRNDAQFWKQTFLNLKPWSDSFHHTQQLMNMTRQFVADQIPEEFNVSKADQIDLLNKSANYFKTKDQFSQAEFETEVLGDVDVIESFRNYGKNFQGESDIDLEDNFQISAHAVKHQARVFKTVLKLDKNFHIYIHGSRELIEKGFDEATGKHYYKIYFDKES